MEILVQLISVTVLSLMFKNCLGNSGLCPKNFTYETVTYETVKTYECCGFLGWGRCSKYRSKSVPVTITKRVWDCCDKYTGPDCDQPLCFGNTTCANGGTCVSPDNCNCTSNFTGESCEQAVCFSETHCANGGTCIAPDVCSCQKAYTGKNCDTKVSMGRQNIPIMNLMVTSLLVSIIVWACRIL